MPPFIRSAFALVLLTLPAVVRAQAAPFSDGYLETIRRAANFVPGPLPTAVHFVNPIRGERIPNDDASKRTAKDSSTIIYPVYQIRFPRGWITVDAAMPRAGYAPSAGFSDAKWANIEVALRDARLSLITHEHSDHTVGVLRPKYGERVQRHTWLTPAQIAGILADSAPPFARVDSATMKKFVAIEYDPYIAIAPGVVLIKTAGHTPGSQTVYVKLASGAEYFIVGDLVWSAQGVLKEQPKSPALLKSMGLVEDQVAIGKQLHWLKGSVDAGVHLVVAHDGEWTAAQVKRGVLKEGFDLRNP